ncbi:MAG: HAD-IIA family hydrolase [Firmicutes bacterium]|jgi:NagD protein|nr:HAD-IIA family hydrolase [Bacillota bacterium]
MSVSVTKRRIAPEFARYDGFIFDLDGTIYLGERLIPGALETVQTLRAHGRRVMFLSNKPLERRGDYARKLKRLGIPADERDVINSGYVLARYLRANYPEARVYSMGEPPLLEEYRDHGIHLLSEDEAMTGAVDIVVATFDRTLTYKKLQAAFNGLKAGARFFATNSDRTCPVEDGELPDAAGVIAFLEATTGRKVELIAGKPNPLMVEAAAEVMGLPPERCLMAGDRLETDMRMGLEAGMGAAAVLSGVSTREEAEAFARRMGEAGSRLHIIASVAALIE